MQKFNRIIVPALAAAMIASLAAPAQARTPARAEAIRNQIEQLHHAVSRNDVRDRISEREAAGLRRDVSRLQDQFRDYNRNGLSNREMRTLERRIHDIRERLRIERRDHYNHRG